MQKDLYMKNPNEKIVIQSDDLKYDGKNIIIPSYYADIISEYLANVDLKNANFNDADMHDFLHFAASWKLL